MMVLDKILIFSLFVGYIYRKGPALIVYHYSLLINIAADIHCTCIHVLMRHLLAACSTFLFQKIKVHWIGLANYDA